jgi:hypothetical protein
MDHSGEYREHDYEAEKAKRKAARKSKEEARRFRRGADIERITELEAREAELVALLREVVDSEMHLEAIASYREHARHNGPSRAEWDHKQIELIEALEARIDKALEEANA